MIGFDLPDNYHNDPEALLRRVRQRLTPPRPRLSIEAPSIIQAQQQDPSMSAQPTMAEKTILTTPPRLQTTSAPVRTRTWGTEAMS